MDTVSYPAPAVRAEVERYFIAYRASLAEQADASLFRDNHVIWTPSVGVADHRGRMHFVSPGYLPPDELVDALRIGRARALMAWMRHAEAATALQQAIDSSGAFAPEALFWLGTALYFRQHDAAPMREAWAELRRRYPDSPWAKRTY